MDLTNVTTTQAAQTSMAVMTAAVTLDLMVMVSLALIPMNVSPILAILMPLARIPLVLLSVSVILALLVMVEAAKLLMIELNSTKKMVCGSVLMDLLVMNSTVKTSMNVMTHHAPEMHLVQTQWDHFTVHVMMVTWVMDSNAMTLTNVMQVHVSTPFAQTTMADSLAAVNQDSNPVQAILIASTSTNVLPMMPVAPTLHAKTPLDPIPAHATMDIVSKAQNFYTSSITRLTRAANHVTALMLTNVSLMSVMTTPAVPIQSVLILVPATKDTMVMVQAVTTEMNVS
jgi:hypothetical protein